MTDTATDVQTGYQPVPAHGPLPSTPKAGVLLHFTSLPSEYGIGDIGAAAQKFVEQLNEMKLSVWQFLPIGPTAYGDSPYQSLSTFAGNENLVDPKALVRSGLLDAKELNPLRQLPRDVVDYDALVSAKTGLLQLAASRFERRAGAPIKTAFQAFLNTNDQAWLDDYALFRALKTHHDQRPWTEWPERYRIREPAALSHFRQQNRDAINSIKRIQFFFFQQWRQLQSCARAHGVQLFGDLPIYIALDSADAWANPDILQLDADGQPSQLAGVPPDYFSEDGQLWGNPLYDWDHHHHTGYQWWLQRIAHASDLFDLVRIDHFRGFQAYWSVPRGADTARQGRWISGPGDALFAALEDKLEAVPIIAEDLGLITPEVTELRLRHQIPGMVVLQFALEDPKFEASQIDENCVCYTGTHDNDTTLGWFHSEPSDSRNWEQLLRLRDEVIRKTAGTLQTIHLDVLRLALASPARLVIVPLQDLIGLGSEARMNTPGTTENNWRWRVVPRQLEAGFRQQVARLINTYDRA